MKSVIAVLAAMAFSLSAAASAPSGSPLNGSIAMPGDTRCDLIVSTPVIDFGTQSRWQLQAVAGERQVSPGKRTLSFSALCPFTHRMAIAVSGARAQDGYFRYGDQGSLRIRLFDAQVNGQSAELALLTPAGAINGDAAAAVSLQPGSRIAVVRNGQIVNGKSFTARLEIEPVMPESAARVSSRQSNESGFTFELLD